MNACEYVPTNEYFILLCMIIFLVLFIFLCLTLLWLILHVRIDVFYFGFVNRLCILC